ncbi:MAG: ATP-binding protein [Cytophagales bacterium]|nr:ATP-binding protein [Cytophagales bacterium]
MDTIKLEIPSLQENVRIVESFIDNTKEKFQLTDDIYGNIMIAVTEAVNNAIVHGNNCDKDKTVKLELTHCTQEGQICFQVEDQGIGFDYEHLPDPTAPENIYKTSGRGIFLMKRLCDEVDFLEKGRIVKLSFYLN